MYRKYNFIIIAILFITLALDGNYETPFGILTGISCCVAAALNIICGVIALRNDRQETEEKLPESQSLLASDIMRNMAGNAELIQETYPEKKVDDL